MFIHYRTQGIILGKIDRDESDRLFTIYTKDYGIINLLARSERKIKSKLRSGLELFYLSEIEFIQGKAQKTLTDAILINKFSIIRKDIERLKVAYQISALVDKLLRGQEPDKEIWKLLNETLEKLNSVHLKDLKINFVYYYFLWNLVSILGYKIDLYDCFICQKKIMLGKIFIILKDGGLVCENCNKKFEKLESIESNSIKILRMFLERDWVTINKLKLDENIFKNIKSISRYYLLGVLEKTQ
ncbi:MAG: DNA repair protein RecO, partial [Candidatus Nealsonbacteria bacterium]